MSKIEQLIQQLCPEGVEYKRLGEVLAYEQPSKYIVASTDYEEDGIPVLTAGQTFILGYTSEQKGIYSASEKNPVIIFDDFTTSFHWVTFDFKVKSSAMKMLKPIGNDVSFRYIYYAMKCIRYETSEHARQWIAKYSQIEIPLPPLPVQQEIVRILDAFTQLEAELEAELEARKKQYAYYRDTLLSFEHDDPKFSIKRGQSNLLGLSSGRKLDEVKVEWKRLGEVCEMRNGYTPSKSKPEYWEDGNIPWFRMEDIRTNGRILSDSIQHITAEGVKGAGLFSANSIILATTATIGEHALIIVDSLANQQFTNLSIRKSLESEIVIKFFFYYMFIVDEWCKNNTNPGTFASVDTKKLANVLIPLPPLPVQQEIVRILDKFEALTSDLQSGLPAEIEARRKQYEYYRDQLLTFKIKN